MASYTKRKTQKGDVWGVRFRVIENGIEVHKNLSPYPTKKKAEEAYRAFMGDYKPNYNTIDKETPSKYEELLERYLISNANHTKESSQYEKPKIFERFITPYFAGRDVRTITKNELFAWQDNLCCLTIKRKGINIKYSYKYVSKIRSYFYNFLTYCSMLLSIPNQMEYIEAPKRKIPKKDIRFWELSEFNQFISKVDDTLYYALFSFAFYTGLRIGEIQAFSESDIVDNAISVNKTYTRKFDRQKYTKGTIYIIIPEPKNYRNYSKQIPDVLFDIMENYLKWKREKNISDKFLFGGDTPIPERTIRRYLENYIEKAKVPTITMHGFRHSYVSLLIHIGCTSKVVAMLIGDTEQQIIHTYSHLYNNDGQTAINNLNKMLSNK